MKEAKYLVETRPKWLEIEKSSPNKPAIVLSQKLGLSRNIKKYPFLESATAKEKETVYDEVGAAIRKTKIFPEKDLVEMNLFTGNSVVEMMLCEKDVISMSCAPRNWARGIFAEANNSLPTVAVNTKNHLEITSFCEIGQEEKTLAKLNVTDNALGEELLYAYDSRLGFLTSKPEECGSGLFTETVIHIPGLVLTQEANEVLNGLSIMGAAAQGLYHEKADAWGAFFKVFVGGFSGGADENEIIEKTKEVQKAVSVAETKARKRLFKEAKVAMEDKICRSFAMMKYARFMPVAQLYNFFSMLRLGVEYKVITSLSLKILNVLFERGLTANLLLTIGDHIESPDDIDIQRASLYRFTLKDVEL